MPAILEQKRVAGIFVWVPGCCLDCNDWIESEQRDYAAREGLSWIRSRFAESGLPKVYCPVINLDGKSGVLIEPRRGESILDTHPRVPKTDGFAVARHLCFQMADGKASKPWLWMFDKPGGTFKSTLGCLALARWIRRGHTGLYVNWPDFCRHVRATFARDSDITEAGEVDRLIETPGLFLDEAGGANGKEHDAGLFYAVLEGRLSRDINADGRRWMVVASNLSIAETVQRYAGVADVRVASRIERRMTEDEMTNEVPIIGTDDAVAETTT